MNLINLTLRVDLRTAGEAQANLDKARSGHLGTHFDVMDKEFPLEYMEREAVVFDVSAIGTGREIGVEDIDLSAVPEGSFRENRHSAEYPPVTQAKGDGTP